MQEESLFNLPPLTRWRKAKMLSYAEKVLSSQHEMTTKKGKNILHYTLQKKRQHERLSHYPKGDRIDKKTGAQYFYHCHREDLDRAEHGHFHCFLRYKFIPKHIQPTPLPDWDKYIENPMTHLVAIGMDLYGQPIRLFTVNRWISSEIWYDAKHLPKFIKRYKMTLQDDPYWQKLDQWIDAMLHLFEPQIHWLHHQRDAFLEQYKLQHPESNAYEIRDLEELSEVHIDLKSQIQWILNN